MSRPATSRLKVNPALGKPPVLEWVSPDELLIDESYQRSIEAESSQTLIRRIAIFWDWALCQPINVARREDGSLWIVDGQHRQAAAKLRQDIAHLPCVIMPYRDKSEEASAFVALNKQRRALGAVDVFKAALAAGDADALAIIECVTDAKLSLAKHNNYNVWKAGELYCIPTIKRCFRLHGRTVTSAGLCALSEAFHGQVLQFAGNMLEGLFSFYAGELKDSSFDPDLFVERLAKNSQFEWVRRARVASVRNNLGRSAAMRSVLLEAYLSARGDALDAAA